MLVAEEPVARERIGRRQRHDHRDDGVERDVAERIDIGHVPGRIGEDGPVAGEGQLLRKEREAAEDLVGRLQRHADQPIDRQQQEDDVENDDEVAFFHGD